MKKTTLLIVLILLFRLGFGQIVAWDMDGNNGDEVTFQDTTHDLGLIISTLSRGSGLTPRQLTNAFSSGNFTVNGSQADALSNNDYLEFQISATNGYRVSLYTLDVNLRRTATGPEFFLWQYSLDGITFTNIGNPFNYSIDSSATSQTQINLSTISELQNVAFGTTISFRLYGWGAKDGNGTFSVGPLPGDDLSLDGIVNLIPTCSGITTTWDGTSWTPSTPTSSDEAIINGDYNSLTIDNIDCCKLTINSPYVLTVDNGSYVSVENDVFVNGTLFVETQGSFVQSSANGIFQISSSGSASITKTTRIYNDAGLHYVYWGSPVKSANIVSTFPLPDDNRRYFFNAANYLDQHTVGTNNGIPDDIDDDGNDWQTAAGVMTPGIGYAVTTVAPPPVPGPINYTDQATFSGVFNTGEVNVTVYRNDDELNDSNWNLISNPYPCAISTDAFFDQNEYDISTNPTGTLEGVIYLWTHNSMASDLNPGNYAYNFSQDDYAYINRSGGVAAISGGETPNKYIPSGQGFFIAMSNDGQTNGGSYPIFTGIASFTNNMRMADITSNSQFFKISNSKTKSIKDSNKLWINLTSDNGVFNQILISYIKGASDNLDKSSYDTKRIPTGSASVLYSRIDNSDEKFVIQGKNPTSINPEEIITLGFKTTIDVPTIYTLSIPQLTGDFLTLNPVYLKDKLLNKTHDLSASEYNFTSEVGEFNDRFEVLFQNSTLSTTEK
ncbi:hypothetical protein KFZ70_05760 [Tamlana fucoidanivorans]|uniref:hypothetical protein n=1 Tax=Allotamlana fucoidanivorans TaxID=2583814 RepID=UPI003891E0BB